MVAVQRTCAKCKAVIPPQQGSARPRKYCTKCSPPRNRPNPRVIHLPAGEPGSTDVVQPVEAPLVAMYRKRLETAEQVETPEGAHVLYLAALLVAGEHTASGAASLSKELRAAMELAVKDAPREPDAIDELEERRRAKVAGAS